MSYKLRLYIYHMNNKNKIYQKNKIKIMLKREDVLEYKEKFADSLDNISLYSVKELEGLQGRVV